MSWERFERRFFVREKGFQDFLNRQTERLWEGLALQEIDQEGRVIKNTNTLLCSKILKAEKAEYEDITDNNYDRKTTNSKLPITRKINS